MLEIEIESGVILVLWAVAFWILGWLIWKEIAQANRLLAKLCARAKAEEAPE